MGATFDIGYRCLLLRHECTSLHLAVAGSAADGLLGLRIKNRLFQKFVPHQFQMGSLLCERYWRAPLSVLWK